MTDEMPDGTDSVAKGAQKTIMNTADTGRSIREILLSEDPEDAKLKEDVGKVLGFLDKNAGSLSNKQKRVIAEDGVTWKQVLQIFQSKQNDLLGKDPDMEPLDLATHKVEIIDRDDSALDTKTMAERLIKYYTEIDGGLEFLKANNYLMNMSPKEIASLYQKTRKVRQYKTGSFGTTNLHKDTYSVNDRDENGRMVRNVIDDSSKPPAPDAEITRANLSEDSAEKIVEDAHRYVDAILSDLQSTMAGKPVKTSQDVLASVVNERNDGFGSTPPWMRLALISRVASDPEFIRGSMKERGIEPSQKLLDNIMAKRVPGDIGRAYKKLPIGDRSMADAALGKDAPKETYYDPQFGSNMTEFKKMSAMMDRYIKNGPKEEPVPEVDMSKARGSPNFYSDTDESEEYDYENPDADTIDGYAPAYETVDQAIDRFVRDFGNAKLNGRDALNTFYDTRAPKLARMIANNRDMTAKYLDNLADRYLYERARAMSEQVIEEGGKGWGRYFEHVGQQEAGQIMRLLAAQYAGVRPEDLGWDDVKKLWDEGAGQYKKRGSTESLTFADVPKEARTMMIEGTLSSAGYDKDRVKAKLEMYALANADKAGADPDLKRLLPKPIRLADPASSKRHGDAMADFASESRQVFDSVEKNRGTMASKKDRPNLLQMLQQGRPFKNLGHRENERMDAIAREMGYGGDTRMVPGTPDDYYVYLYDENAIPADKKRTGTMVYEGNPQKPSPLDGIVMNPDTGAPFMMRMSDVPEEYRSRVMPVPGDYDEDNVLRMDLRDQFTKRKFKNQDEGFTYDITATRNEDDTPVFRAGDPLVLDNPILRIPDSRDYMKQRARLNKIYTLQQRAKDKDLGSKRTYSETRKPVSVHMKDALDKYKRYNKAIQHMRNPVGYRGRLMNTLNGTGYKMGDLAALDDIWALAYHMLPDKDRAGGFDKSNRALMDMANSITDDLKYFVVYSNRAIDALEKNAEEEEAKGNMQRAEQIRAKADEFRDTIKRMPLSHKARTGARVQYEMPYTRLDNATSEFLKTSGDVRADGTRGEMRIGKLTPWNIGDYAFPSTEYDEDEKERGANLYRDTFDKPPRAYLRERVDLRSLLKKQGVPDYEADKWTNAFEDVYDEYMSREKKRDPTRISAVLDAMPKLAGEGADKVYALIGDAITAATHDITEDRESQQKVLDDTNSLINAHGYSARNNRGKFVSWSDPENEVPGWSDVARYVPGQVVLPEMLEQMDEKFAENERARRAEVNAQLEEKKQAEMRERRLRAIRRQLAGHMRDAFHTWDPRSLATFNSQYASPTQEQIDRDAKMGVRHRVGNNGEYDYASDLDRDTLAYLSDEFDALVGEGTSQPGSSRAAAEDAAMEKIIEMLESGARGKKGYSKGLESPSEKRAREAREAAEEMDAAIDEMGGSRRTAEVPGRKKGKKNKTGEGSVDSMSADEETAPKVASMSISEMIRKAWVRKNGYTHDDLDLDPDRISVFRNTAYPVHFGEGYTESGTGKPKKNDSEGTVQKVDLRPRRRGHPLSPFYITTIMSYRRTYGNQSL